MSTETVPSRPDMFKKTINVFLLFANVATGLGLLSASQFTGLQVHERAFIIAASLLFTLFMVVKEFKVKPLLKRIYLNLLVWAGFLGIGYYISLVW